MNHYVLFAIAGLIGFVVGVRWRRLTFVGQVVGILAMALPIAYILLV